LISSNSFVIKINQLIHTIARENLRVFFDAMGFSNEELTNYSSIARDCTGDHKTVKGYYQILVYTLLGKKIFPLLGTKLPINSISRKND